jgi:hypothetical protein
MQLSEQQAYLAAFAFLNARWELTGSDDLGALLGAMSLLPDGGTADPAIGAEWADAVQAALAGRVDASMRLVP